MPHERHPRSALLCSEDGAITPERAFGIATEFGILTFRLPAQVDSCLRDPLLGQRESGALYAILTRRARAAWRIVLYWLDQATGS